MSIKELANEDFTIEATGVGWTPGDPMSPSAMTLTLTKAGNAKASGKLLLLDKVSWTVIAGACSLSGCTHVSGGSVAPGLALMATAMNCKADSKAVLRNGDIGTCSGKFTNNSTGLTVVCTCVFEITDAGQTNALGE